MKVKDIAFSYFSYPYVFALTQKVTKRQ